MLTPIQLEPVDAERYARLRRRMLDDAPWAFGASPEDDFGLDVEHLARMLATEQYAIIAVESPSSPGSNAGEARGRPELVAAASVYRVQRRKSAHRARIWGVFVDPGRRGKGLGRSVMTAAIDLARRWPGVDFIDLGVSQNAPEARRLYVSLGFEEWGREPEAIAIGGQRYDEHYLTLRLRAPEVTAR